MVTAIDLKKDFMTMRLMIYVLKMFASIWMTIGLNQKVRTVLGMDWAMLM